MRKGIRASRIQSTAGHEESRGKSGGPPSKPKYYLMTDRGAVPWGKGEKDPGRGVKENLKPCAYKHIEPINVWYGTFCRTVRRAIVCCELKVLRTGGVARASLNRAFSSMQWARNRVTYPWSGWSESKISWRAEPTSVEKAADELWVAEKFQSNSEIAGSPRNSFRASVDLDYRR